MHIQDLPITEVGLGVFVAVYVIEKFVQYNKANQHGHGANGNGSNGNGVTKVIMELKDMEVKKAQDHLILQRMGDLFDQIEELNQRIDELSKKP